MVNIAVAFTFGFGTQYSLHAAAPAHRLNRLIQGHATALSNPQVGRFVHSILLVELLERLLEIESLYAERRQNYDRANQDSEKISHGHSRVSEAQYQPADSVLCRRADCNEVHHSGAIVQPRLPGRADVDPDPEFATRIVRHARLVLLAVILVDDTVAVDTLFTV